MLGIVRECGSASDSPRCNRRRSIPASMRAAVERGGVFTSPCSQTSGLSVGPGYIQDNNISDLTYPQAPFTQLRTDLITVPFLLLLERLLQSLLRLFARVVNVGAREHGLVLRDRVAALSGQVVNLGGPEQGERRQVGVGALRFRDFQEMLSRAFVVTA